MTDDTFKSINEPNAVSLPSDTPASINEPTAGQVQTSTPPAHQEEHQAHAADPDELEEEIEEAEEEGDFKPTHSSHRRGHTSSHRRKK